MRRSWVVLSVLCACGDDSGAKVDASVPYDEQVIDSNDPNMPQSLAEAGLCMDAGCMQIEPGNIPYKPRFELYSDGATKKRWIHLPAGTQIDTTDMDFWQFPIGTKLFKEFTRDNVRVETRLIQRIANIGTSADWYYAAFVWNQTQDATHLAEFGEMDANGTPHDVPARFQCKQCHENLKPSRILGFSALQLDYDGAVGDLDLADLVTMNLLTTNPTASGGLGAPFFPFEAAIGSTEYQALGYLHANCGHCHNPSTSVATTAIRLRLTVGTVGTTSSTPVHQTAVGQTAQLPINNNTLVIDAGSPSTSTLIDRFLPVMEAWRMPQVGVSVTDMPAEIMLEQWITDL